MNASFTKSTLSLMAFISLLAVIAMIFLWVDPDEKLIWLISWVIWAYIWARNPQQEHKEEIPQSISKEEETLLLAKYSAHDPKE